MAYQEILLICVLALISSSTAFVHNGVRVSTSSTSTSLNGFFKDFFQELDNFVDDATSRRLGNGAAFYGKRKSNFYGEDDVNKKQDSKIADPTEDYQGPSSSGFFKWDWDEEGQLRPVSRMKGKNLERPQSFWDRQFASSEDE